MRQYYSWHTFSYTPLRMSHEHFSEFMQRYNGKSGESTTPAQQLKAEKLPEKAEYIEVY